MSGAPKPQNPEPQSLKTFHLRCYNPKPMTEAERQARVQELRERVDEVDLELIRALSERAQIVQDLARIKFEAGIPIFDPKREEEILRRVVEQNPGPIYDSSMREIFELILHRIRDLEIQRGEFQR